MTPDTMTAASFVVVERRRDHVIGVASTIDEARDIVRQWRAASVSKKWPVAPGVYGLADIYTLVEAEDSA